DIRDLRSRESYDRVRRIVAKNNIKVMKVSASGTDEAASARNRFKKPVWKTKPWSHVHSSLMRSGRRRYWLAVLGVERGVPFYAGIGNNVGHGSSPARRWDIPRI